jgi:hypothetical protein
VDAQLEGTAQARLCSSYDRAFRATTTLSSPALRDVRFILASRKLSAKALANILSGGRVAPGRGGSASRRLAVNVD